MCNHVLGGFLQWNYGISMTIHITKHRIENTRCINKYLYIDIPALWTVD